MVTVGVVAVSVVVTTSTTKLAASCREVPDTVRVGIADPDAKLLPDTVRVPNRNSLQMVKSAVVPLRSVADTLTGIMPEPPEIDGTVIVLVDLPAGTYPHCDVAELAVMPVD